MLKCKNAPRACSRPHLRLVGGTVYLIHFDRPYFHARHYCGWTGRDLYERIEEHALGKREAARLMQIIVEADIGWTVVRTWTGTRALERRLKDSHHLSRYCPVCQAWGGTVR